VQATTSQPATAEAVADALCCVILISRTRTQQFAGDWLVGATCDAACFVRASAVRRLQPLLHSEEQPPAPNTL